MIFIFHILDNKVKHKKLKINTLNKKNKLKIE